jgi:hypothetical protein
MRERRAPDRRSWRSSGRVCARSDCSEPCPARTPAHGATGARFARAPPPTDTCQRSVATKSRGARAAQVGAPDPPVRPQPPTGRPRVPQHPSARRAVAGDVEGPARHDQTHRVIAGSHPGLVGDPAPIHQVAPSRGPRVRDPRAGEQPGRGGDPSDVENPHGAPDRARAAPQPLSGVRPARGRPGARLREGAPALSADPAPLMIEDPNDDGPPRRQGAAAFLAAAPRKPS